MDASGPAEQVPTPPPSRLWRVMSVGLLLVAVLLTAAPFGRTIEGDARVYVEAAHSLTEGHYTAASEPTGVPRYPPGFPVMLAPFVSIWGDGGAKALSSALGAVLVGLVWLAALRLEGHRAAATAALLWCASPLVRDYGSDVMSDPAGAVFVMVGLLAALRGRWVVTGLALAWSSWIRLIHVVFLAALGRRPAAWLAAAGLLAPLVVFQLHTYGRLAGYGGAQAEFSWSHIFGGTPLQLMDSVSPWPNWQFFPGLLWGLRFGLVPMLPLFAGYELIVRRSEPAAQLAAWVVTSNVIVYLPYFYQAPRFVLPAACLVIVFSAAGVIRVVDSVRDTGDDRGDVPSPTLRSSAPRDR
jgi:hypothetical protein